MSDPPIGVDRQIGKNSASVAGLDVGLPAVLLVDDQPARLLSAEAILADLPVRCVRALSGEEALTRLLRQPFAAIVLDVCLPGMDGFETARLIRAHHRFQTIPIVFVTGVHLTELDRLKGYEIGAIDYLSIPVVPEILRGKIAILVELHQRRRELEELTRALVAARSHLQSSEFPNINGRPDKTTNSRRLDPGQYDELLKNVSHDLRNALSPIHYLVEVLLVQTATTNPIRPVLHMIRQYSSRISRLADDFDARVSRGP